MGSHQFCFGLSAMTAYPLSVSALTASSKDPDYDQESLRLTDMNSFLIDNSTRPHPQLICKRHLTSATHNQRTHQNGQFLCICFKVAAGKNNCMWFPFYHVKRNTQLPHPQFLNSFHRNSRQYTCNQSRLEVVVRLKAERRRSLYSIELVSL